MQPYLSYRKPEHVNWLDPTSELLPEAVIEQYADLPTGAYVYVITSLDIELYLLGRVVPNKCREQNAVARTGRAREHFDDMDSAIFSAEADFLPATPVECEDSLRKIYMVPADHPLQTHPKIAALLLNGIQEITPASAAILDDLLKGNTHP